MADLCRDSKGVYYEIKKTISILLTLIFAFSFSVSGYASSNTDYGRYDEYLGYIEDGYIDESISYSLWLDLLERNAEFEQKLEESSELALVYNSNSAGLYSTYSLQPGDIYLTNATSLGGLTGHTGIAINTAEILHIAGPLDSVSTISRSDWLTDYSSGWTKVYRHTNNTIARLAAGWAYNNYFNSNAVYSFDVNLATTDKTYCSKIVWQSYYFINPVGTYADFPGNAMVVLPYEIPELIHPITQVY